MFFLCSNKLSDEDYQKKISPKHLALVFEKQTSYLGKEVQY